MIYCQREGGYRQRDKDKDRVRVRFRRLRKGKAQHLKVWQGVSGNQLVKCCRRDEGKMETGEQVCRERQKTGPGGKAVTVGQKGVAGIM